MLFALNSKDYTSHIVAGTYKINSKDEYESYVDVKCKTHNVKLRERVSGTFDIFFRTIAEYETFLTDYASCRSALNNSYYIHLNPNNKTGNGEMYNCFVTFEPTRDIDGVRQDYFKTFTVTVEER